MSYTHCIVLHGLDLFAYYVLCVARASLQIESVSTGTPSGAPDRLSLLAGAGVIEIQEDLNVH
jgi:hypothetical protein